MLKKFQLVLLVSFLFLCHSTTVSASEYNSLAQQTLLKKVKDYVSQEVNPEGLSNIRVKTLPLDRRIRIRPCSVPLTFELAQKRSYTRQFPVKVSCNGDTETWKLFAQVHVNEYIETLVTTEHIAKGEIVDESKFAVTLVDKHRIRNRSTNSSKALIGGRAMRNIPRGYQISDSDVCLVCKGDDVAIVAKSEFMMIKTSGTAIENGSLGESIKVKNNSSDRIVKGVIGELRQVYVNL
mgnify:FL=1